MILVTGGTGLVGSHLLLALCKEHKAIRATYRHPDKIKTVAKIFAYYHKDPQPLLDKIAWVQADILDLPSLAQAFIGVTQVYHAAALISFDPKDDQKLLDTNVEGSANVANLCIQNGISKLCFVSSIAALGSSIQGEPITEETEWTGAAATYGTSKHFAEMEIWRASQEGVPVVIINPGVIVAPGFWDTSSGRFFKHAAKGPKYHLPSGTGFVGITDVVQAMLSLMQSSITNQRYILVNKNWSHQQFAQILAAGLHKPAPTKKIKPWVLQLLWRLDWLKGLFTQKPRLLSKATAQGFKTTAIYDNSKLKKDLDFTYTDLEQETKDYCTIFLAEAQKS